MMKDILKTEWDRIMRNHNLRRAERCGRTRNRVRLTYCLQDISKPVVIRTVVESMNDTSIRIKTGEIIPITSVMLIEF